LQNGRRTNSENYAISATGRKALPGNDFRVRIALRGANLHHYRAPQGAQLPSWCARPLERPIFMLRSIILPSAD